MQTDFENLNMYAVSYFHSATFLMQSIRNAVTQMVFSNGPDCYASGFVATLGTLGDQGTWLPVRPAVTYIYTLLRPSVAEHLAHPIA